MFCCAFFPKSETTEYFDSYQEFLEHEMIPNVTNDDKIKIFCEEIILTLFNIWCLYFVGFA